MKIQRIYIGGWFQRTTLHLTEIWDFLKHKKSHSDFPAKKLLEAQAVLGITLLERRTAGLEYIYAETKDGLTYRIYEDGLIILEREGSGNLQKDFDLIRNYYDKKLSSSLSYIFSKGAPVPKELANIKTILPYIVTIQKGSRQEVTELYKKFKEEIYSTIATKNTQVYRSPQIIIINGLANESLAREIVESQIFFREFKTQLHRYLQIHRILWEKIAVIKEKGSIKGTEIDTYRNELSDYQKTVGLISSRIDQMGVYIRTRQKITDLKKVDEYLSPLVQFKFETLQDTHEYITYLWEMTAGYLSSAIEMFSELQQKSTKSSLSSLQVITTVGVVAGILGYLGRDQLPAFTQIGLLYFVLLLAMTWVINFTVSKFYKNKQYSIKGSDIIKNIK
jgi:hypothetical protein